MDDHLDVVVRGAKKVVRLNDLQSGGMMEGMISVLKNTPHYCRRVREGQYETEVITCGRSQQIVRCDEL